MKSLFRRHQRAKKPPQDRRIPDLSMCEPRQLMDAVSTEVLASEAERYANEEIPSSDPSPVHAPLSDGGNNAPYSTGLPWILDAEDSTNRVVALHESFFDDDQLSTSLEYRVSSNSAPELFDAISFDETGNLTIDFAKDAFGEAEIIIQARDSDGAAVEDTLVVTLLPYNDKPTTTGLSDISIEYGQFSTVVDLFQVFDDTEDADNELTYSVTQNTNPDLFSSVVIDQSAGTLTFYHAIGATGESQITLRATDSAGAYVETTLADADYPVYSLLWGGPQAAPDTDAMGLGRVNYVTSFAIFDIVDGEYDYSTVSEQKFRDYLHSDYVVDGLPLIIDIEQPEFDNSPEGRDMWAQVLSIVEEERPELQQGIYAYLPSYGYWPLQRFGRLNTSLDWDVSNWYTANATSILQGFEEWQLDTAEFRDSSLGPDYNNRTLGDMLEVLTPSFYTHYRYGYSSNPNQLSEYQVEIDSEVDRISAPHNSLAEGLRVSFSRTNSSTLPPGIVVGQSYFIVNLDGSTFQLSETRDGEAISFGGNGTDNFVMTFLDSEARRNYLNDPTVMDWTFFIDGMLQEAEKSEVPVLTWLSPSFKGKGAEYLDPELFRFQLETLKDRTDGILLWNPDVGNASDPENHGWWGVLDEFMTSLQTPTQFTILVEPTTNERGGNSSPYDSGQQYLVTASDDEQFLPPAPAGVRVDFVGTAYSGEHFAFLRSSWSRWGNGVNSKSQIESEDSDVTSAQSS